MKYNPSLVLKCLGVTLLVVLVVSESIKQVAYRQLRGHGVILGDWNGGVNVFRDGMDSSWFATPASIYFDDSSVMDVSKISGKIGMFSGIKSASFLLVEGDVANSYLQLLRSNEVESLFFYKCHVPDAVLKNVVEMPKLRRLATVSTGIGDDQLSMMRRSHTLRVLEFEEENITLSGLNRIRDMGLGKLTLLGMKNIKSPQLIELKKMFPGVDVQVVD